MKKNVAIIDYGLGNILSAQQSFIKVANEFDFNASVFITSKPNDIIESTHIILPGQGAFKTCMQNLLNIRGMIDVLNLKVLKKKTPFLGICVGMQLLANTSYENGKHTGLGWINGEIKKLPSEEIKLPHMGWNNINVLKENKLVNYQKNDDFYFVHSYYFDCFSKENIVATTDYGINFTSIVSKENIYGVQFHPEKSSKQGLNLIKNFLML